MDKQDLKYKFLFEEYKAMRKEIDDTMKLMRQVFFVNLVGSGSVWSLILTNHDVRADPNPIKYVLYWIPPILSMFCGFYMYVHRKHIIRMGEFIQAIEIELLETSSNLGWEHYMKKFRFDGLRSTEGFENVYSIGLIVINAVGTVVMYIYN